MPRAPAVTADEVSQACDRLLARGQRPTHRLVRLEVGRGSLSTIAQHLHAWLDRKAKHEGPAGPVADSIRALEALSPSAAATVREAFRAEAATELAAARSHAELANTKVQDLEDALATSERERENLVDRVQQLEDHVGGLSRSLQDLVPSIIDRLESLAASCTHEIKRVASDAVQRLDGQAALVDNQLSLFARLIEVTLTEVQASASTARAGEQHLIIAIRNSHASTEQLQNSIENDRKKLEGHCETIQKSLSHLSSLTKGSLLRSIRLAKPV